MDRLGHVATLARRDTGGCNLAAAGPLSLLIHLGWAEGFRQRLRWGWVAEAMGDGPGSPELFAIF